MAQPESHAPSIRTYVWIEPYSDVSIFVFARLLAVPKPLTNSTRLPLMTTTDAPGVLFALSSASTVFSSFAKSTGVICADV